MTESPVVRFGFRSLRHSLATWLAETGMSPDVIQAMLRHGSKGMTMHYVHSTARKAQEQYVAEPNCCAFRDLISGPAKVWE
jgi:integrase